MEVKRILGQVGFYPVQVPDHLAYRILHPAGNNLFRFAGIRLCIVPIQVQARSQSKTQ